ncbi:MAG: D-alanyl-D-alanine carboxypeptidase/D-alanyl-D-alanine-endopeptidase [Bacteroidota bacterium]|nr:D-alanyl-D-alanine carboxypeptidase/D-alanyl-D-alanine-endopeptidase [Bacteroidota bacterium]
MKLRMYLWIVIVFTLLPGADAAGQSKSSTAARQLSSAIDAALENDLFAHTLAAVEVTDLRSGKTVYSRNAQLLLRPASNAKLVTSAAVVLGVDSAYRFRTLLAAADSSLRLLVCTGGADPLLTSQDIQKLAESAYAAGVREVDTLLLDNSLLDSSPLENSFYGAGWMWDDESDPFMPYLSAFPVDRNTITLHLKSPTQHGEPVRFSVLPSSNLIHVENNARSGARSDLHVEKLPRSNTILLRGTLAAGRRVTRRVSMWRPPELFADLLLAALRVAGVRVDSARVISGSLRNPTLPLGEIAHPLEKVLEKMNKDSDNLCAESALRVLGAQGKSLGAQGKSRGVTAGDGLAAAEQILRRAGVETENLHLRDGSGISFYNLLTARSLSSLLAVMAAHPRFPRFRASLSIAGGDGTLARRMTGIEKGAFFRGKTGTVSGVSALSGYAQAPGGRLLGVVMLMQNFHGRHKPYRDVQDEIVRHCIVYSGDAN